MKKAVFFDIDGTLWDFHQKIPKSTIEAIKTLRANGNYAFLCSGRTKAFIHDGDLLGIGFDGIVAGCGTYVEMDGKVVENHVIDKDLLEETVSILKGYHMPLVLEGVHHLFVDEEDFYGDPFLKIMQDDMGENLRRITGDDTEWIVNKLSVNAVPEYTKDVIKRLGNDYEFLLHGNEFFEMVPLNYTKARGMETVCERLGIKTEDSFAFGDATNDIHMLKAAGTGIAMGNGTDGAKKAADYVTSDIWDDGIKNGLRHFGLI